MIEPMFEDKNDTDQHLGESCNACGYQGVPLKMYYMQLSRTDDRRLPEARTKQGFLFCEICASTPIGTAYAYPEQYRNERNILMALGWIGNFLNSKS